MKVTLTKMVVVNFKGIEKFTIEPNGHNCDVFGHNATGKTTLIDAFLWCLTDKDSCGNSVFDIIPHDENHQQMHHLDTVVELHLSVQKEDKTYPAHLKKVLQEKWSRPRGQSEEVYSGTKTTYYLDNEAVTKTQYNKLVIDEIVKDDSAFRLLSNLRYFAEDEKLGWKGRRDLLFSLLPKKDGIEQKLLNSPGFIALKQISDFDKFETTTNQSIKALQKKQVETTAKLEENQSLLQSTESQADKSTLEKVISAGEQELTTLRKELAQLINESEHQGQKHEWDKEAEMIKLEHQKQNLQLNLGNLRKEYNSLSDNTSRDNDLLANMRKAVVEKKRQLQSYVPSTTCPTCHQSLPANQIESARQLFNVQVNDEIAEIAKRGKSLAKLIAENTQLSVDLEGVIEKNEAEIAQIEKQITRLNEKPEKQPVDLASMIQEKQTEIEKKDAALQPVRQELLKFKNKADIEKRIAELNTDFDKVGKQIIQLERQVLLIKEFRIEKNKALTAAINKLFKTVSFELFKSSIDGNETEACVVLVKGQRYDTNNVNGAGKISAGLEIVDVFSKHYDTYLPIFIDDAVTIFDIPGTQAQQIRLYADRGTKALTVKVHYQDGGLF